MNKSKELEISLPIFLICLQSLKKSIKSAKEPLTEPKYNNFKNNRQWLIRSKFFLKSINKAKLFFFWEIDNFHLSIIEGRTVSHEWLIWIHVVGQQKENCYQNKNNLST